MSHNFKQSRIKGDEGEAILDRHFAKWFKIVPATINEQKQGIDRIFYRRHLSPYGQAGQALKIEYKSDYRASETGNAFIETISVEGEKMGWSATSKADKLIYFLPPINLYYQLSILQIRHHLQHWETIYPCRYAVNESYRGQGILVPLDVIWQVADSVQILDE